VDTNQQYCAGEDVNEVLGEFVAPHACLPETRSEAEALAGILRASEECLDGEFVAVPPNGRWRKCG
jgi:hypothetical protein